MRSRVVMLCGAAGLLLSVGCDTRAPVAPPPSAPSVPPQPSIRPTMTTQTNPPELLASKVRFIVLCDAMLIDSPEGVISSSKRLWRHLREDQLGVRETDHLGRNGFRVGIGRAADFGSVRKLLAAMRDTTISPGRLRFDGEAAIELPVAPEIRGRRAFLFAPDGSLSGADYKPCASIYWVQAWHDIEHIDAVNVTLVPELRWGRVRERLYTPTIERARQWRDVGRLFDEVRLNRTLKRGEFILLGPNPDVRGAMLGRVFFTTEQKGQKRERALLVRPRVVRMPNA